MSAKKKITPLWLLVCSSALLPGPARAKDSMPIVAVFDIEDKGAGLSSATMSNLTDYLVVLLTEAGYQVVPREQIRERILQQKKESYRECYDRACQIELGRELAADKSLATQLIQVGGSCRLAAVLLDLKRSTTEKAATVRSDCREENLLVALEELVRRFTGKEEAAPESSQVVPPPGGEARPEVTPAVKPAARSFLGVQIQPLDAAARDVLGLAREKNWLILSGVIPQSPAEKAGLAQGDVLLSLDGEQVGEPAAFVERIGKKAPGERAVFELMRGGEVTVLEAVLEAPPARDLVQEGMERRRERLRQLAEKRKQESRFVEQPPAEKVSPPQEKPGASQAADLAGIALHVGPVFENLGQAMNLENASVGGNTLSGTISPGTGFFLELKAETPMNQGNVYYTLGASLFYYFNNTSDDEMERISYLTGNLLSSLVIPFTSWLEFRIVFELGLGFHLGSKMYLEDSANPPQNTAEADFDWDMGGLFLKTGLDLAWYPFEHVGFVLSFGVFFETSAELSVEGNSYPCDIPPLLFLSLGTEIR